ncbi:MAG: LPP20 family lipoprotein, partial [Myxococcota bacterium]|nr:LPP20 family lipoprotein [Myxococcota bacterium]
MKPYNSFVSVSAALLLGFVATPADARGGKAGLQDRAACASISLAIAVGEAVSDADRAKCGSRGRKAASKAADSPAVSAPQINRPPARQPQTSRPDWIDRPPAADGILYGVGSGSSARDAFAQAVSMVGAQIKVTIKSELRVHSEESTTTESDGKERTTGRDNVSSTTRMLVHGVLEDVVFEDQYVDKGAEETWVLASLNIAALRAKEQAVLDAVLGSLSGATERLVDRMRGEGVFDQGAMSDVIDVLIETIDMGKSKFGKKVKKKWKKPFRALKAAARGALSCLEVADASGEPLTEPLDPGEHRLLFQCNGVPIVNTRLVTDVQEGLAVIS